VKTGDTVKVINGRRKDDTGIIMTQSLIMKGTENQWIIKFRRNYAEIIPETHLKIIKSK